MGNRICVRGLQPMRVKLLIVMILVVFSTGIVLSVIVIKNKNVSDVDLVAINDVVKTVEKNWGHLMKKRLITVDLKQPFTIIDHLGMYFIKHQDITLSTYMMAIKNRDTVIDVKQEKTIVGKVIIPNNEQEFSATNEK